MRILYNLSPILGYAAALWLAIVLGGSLTIIATVGLWITIQQRIDRRFE